MTAARDDILEYFAKISAIPRRSREEAQIKAWIKSWAEERDFSHKEDAIGNLVCYVPGKGSLESSAPIVIQGHLDMVCEKTPDSPHDFSKDGIELVYDGDWLSANQTTLGADNGIAIAMAMKLADDKNVEHPPLELLFTIDEETGLTGALELDPSLISGKTLINIDTEDEGVFTVGCAGGNTCYLHFQYEEERQTEGDYVFAEVYASGMKGGHSGVDIHQQRANAVRVLMRALKDIAKTDEGFRISSINGGSAHNAIPRDAKAVIRLSASSHSEVEALIQKLRVVYQKEFAASDPNLDLSIKSIGKSTCIDRKGSISLLDTIMLIPHGVTTMSLELKGIVETSANLAQISSEGCDVKILTSQRSSIESRLEAVTEKIVSLTRLAGGTCKVDDGYPAWEPNWESPIIGKAVECYKSLFDKEPVVEIIHAGLECGIIGDKVPGMEMISFGPTIVDPHSPQERIKISDVDKVWRLLVELVKVI